uniref:Uncharacterized protein n=1 Tax=Solanum tuberosum TaxID=4113 RepID=M1DNN8_SOLTU
MKYWKTKGLVTHEPKYPFPSLSLCYKPIKSYSDPILGKGKDIDHKLEHHDQEPSKEERRMDKEARRESRRAAKEKEALENQQCDSMRSRALASRPHAPADSRYLDIVPTPQRVPIDEGVGIPSTTDA